MKRLFKKNQIIITTLAVMIAIAGYLNYSGKLFSNSKDNATETNADLANQELLDISEEDSQVADNEIKSNDAEETGTPGEAVLTSSSASSVVAQAKVTREQVRAQNKETLQNIIDNTELTDDQKADAVTQMAKLTQLAEEEADIETLMTTKGFTESVVSLTQDSADIVVKIDELSEASRAQIEDIVTRKTEISPENIVITPIQNE
ncbi:MAG: SpoIIIAH-like family protein [Hespellia sp.]|nr:SpoIIIAH-like family protein [Hespellia sp.]